MSTSKAHRSGGAVGTVEDVILDGAASCVIDFGLDRITLAEIARRAGVSRPTIYRRWPDSRAIIAALLTREIAALVEQVPDRGPTRELLVERIVAVAQRVRDHPMFDAILRSRPELMMTYVLTRLGTSQHALIDALEVGIRRGQAHGSVRPGNAQQLATMLLLITQSAIQSARMVEPILSGNDWARELALALNGYLA